MRLKRQRLDFDGGPAGYLTLGPEAIDHRCRPPVVMLHGFGGDSLSWQFTLPHLAHRHPVIAIDLPGHGGSTQNVGDGALAGLAGWLWRALDSLLPALGLAAGPVHLLGHSMGGKVALLAAGLRPEQTESLALISPAGVAPDVDVALLHRVLEARTEEQALDCINAMLGRQSPLHQTALPETMARGLLYRMAGPVSTTALRTIMERAFSVIPPAESHRQPMDWRQAPRRLTVIWGDDDRLVPLPSPAYLPDGERVHVLPGVGHLPPLEAPSTVNALLDAFFDPGE